MLRFKIITILLLSTLSMDAQVYHPIPDSREIGSEQSDLTVIWVNPSLLQPSIFFNKNGVDQQAERKWWRKEVSSPTLETKQLALIQDKDIPNISKVKSLDLNFTDHKFKLGESIAPPKPLWAPRILNSYQVVR